MRLLIVADRQDNLLILSRLLKEYFPDVEIFTASSAAEGISLACDKQVDGAIIDLQLPGMHGIEMCRQLKTDPWTAQSALILLTAHSADPKLKAQGLEAGADDFIIRPFDNVEFIARVKVMLRVKKAENDLLEINQQLEQRVADKIDQLQKSEERLRQISENSHDWIWEVDTKGVYTYSSPPVNFLGYRAEEIVGKKNFFDFFPPACREELKTAAFQTFEKKQPFNNFTNPNIGKNKEIFWLSTSGVPVLDKNGDLLGYRGADQDITERKKAEDLQSAQLRLVNYSAKHTISELLEQFIAEAEALTDSEIGFYHFVEDDQETLTLQTWSKNTFEKRCGNQIAGRHYPISKAGVWVDCIRLRKPVIHNDYASLPHKKELPEGHPSIVRELVVPIIRGGKIKAVLGVGNKQSNYCQADVLTIQRLADISWETVVAKRTNAERDLLRSAVEQAAEAIVITDNTGSIQFVNPAFEQITGYSRAEMLGQNPRILNSGKTSSTTYQEMWSHLLAGKNWRGEFTNKKKDGSLYTEEVAISPVINAAGVATHYVAVKTDITQALELEDQLRQSQKIQAIGQLAGGIAHDFNNILTIILGYGAMVIKHLPPDNHSRADVETMVIAAKKAEKLTRQLLAFSRRQVLEVKTVDLNTLVADFIPLLKKLLRENIRLNFSPAEKSVLIQVDPTQAEQVLVNLIVNARDAIGEQEGAIDIQISQSKVGARAQNIPLTDPNREFGLITVEDTGSGIAEGIIEQIFDPFFTTKAQGHGTGLGLSTVYGIVKQSGGYLFVESTPEIGTQFFILLPLGEQKAEAVAAQPLRKTDLKLALKVLVVDDQEQVLSVIAQTLVKEGHQVVTTTDPLEALELWSESKDEFDLVITDVGMPGMSGVDLANKFIDSKKSANILYISGYGELHKGKKNSPQQNMKFLQKPFTPDDLLAKIDAMFHKNEGAI